MGGTCFFQRLALSSRSVKTRPFLNAPCLAGVERDGIGLLGLGKARRTLGTNSLLFVPHRFCASTRRVHIIRSVSVKKDDNTVA